MKAEPPKVNKIVTRIKVDDNSLFIGLESYSEKQAELFFGRDKEIAQLSSLVKMSSLTLLFGKSGTGKTSLLNAGVFPVLRKEYCMPFRIRLKFLKDSPNILTQIKQVLKKDIDDYGFSVESYPADETLWEYFHREPLWKLITPILIFDQFEEIFTLGQKNPDFKKENLDAFVEELSSVIENEVPEKVVEFYLQENKHIPFSYDQQKAKIIFSFREEYLPEFESFSVKIPSIKDARYRLMPMNGLQALEVIMKTWGNDIEEAEAEEIVGLLTNHPSPQTADEKSDKSWFQDKLIEPSLLSQVCLSIDKKRQKGKVSANFLNKDFINNVLRSLYDEVLAEGDKEIDKEAKKNYPAKGQQLELKEGKRITNNRFKIKGEHSSANSEKVTNPFQGQLQEFIEDNLITDEGFRTRYNLHKIPLVLMQGIKSLTLKYFIREDDDTIELTHDVIVALVIADRDKRRKAIAIAAAKTKAKRRQLFISMLAILLASVFVVYALIKSKKLENYNGELIGKNDELEANIELLHVDSSKLSIENQKLYIQNQKEKEEEEKIKRSNDTLQLLYSKNDERLAKLQNHLDSINNAIKEKEKAFKKEEPNADLPQPRPLPPKTEPLPVVQKKDTIRVYIVDNKKPNINIDSMRNRIRKLEDSVLNYKKIFPLYRVFPSKKKDFGYGYDYAEDKVKKP